MSLLDYAAGNKPLYRYEYKPELGFDTTWYLGAAILLLGLLSLLLRR